MDRSIHRLANALSGSSLSGSNLLIASLRPVLPAVISISIDKPWHPSYCLAISRTNSQLLLLIIRPPLNCPSLPLGGGRVSLFSARLSQVFFPALASLSGHERASPP